MKKTNTSNIKLIDHMGSDLSVVNAARVSFDKESKWEFDNTNYLGHPSEDYCLNNRDEKLINYLAKHNHWSPFAHNSIQFRISAPIFVARQLVKHQVGGVWNEVSRRYVDDEPTFYFPEKWRKRAEKVKQGSSTEEYEGGFAWEQGLNHKFTQLVDTYTAMIKNGCAPEQARMILPQNMMTTWYWTGSLMFFHRVFKQRTDNHAQQETQEVALQIGKHCARLFPVSWRALNEIV